jgi:hypothetical protein
VFRIDPSTVLIASRIESRVAMISAKELYFVGGSRRANRQKIPTNNAIDPLKTPDAPAWRNRKAIPRRKSARRMTRIFSKRICIAKFEASVDALPRDSTACGFEDGTAGITGKWNLRMLPTLLSSQTPKGACV